MISDQIPARDRVDGGHRESAAVLIRVRSIRRSHRPTSASSLELMPLEKSCVSSFEAEAASGSMAHLRMRSLEMPVATSMVVGGDAVDRLHRGR
jgi:hypothetical protein